MNDRRYPQVRVNKAQSEVICSKTIENVDGTADNSQSNDYRYDQLFS